MKHDPRKIEKRYEFYRCESCKKQIAETIYDDRGAKAHVEFERCFFADNNPYCASCMSIRPLTLSERTEKRRREQAERQREMDAETRRVMGEWDDSLGPCQNCGIKRLVKWNNKEASCAMCGHKHELPSEPFTPVADAGSPDRSDGGKHLRGSAKHALNATWPDTRQNDIGAYIIPMDAIHPKGEPVTITEVPGSFKIEPPTGGKLDVIDHGNGIKTYHVTMPPEPVARDCDGRKDQ